MAKDEQTSVQKSEPWQAPAIPHKGWGPFWDLRNEIDDLFEDFFPASRRFWGWGRRGNNHGHEMSIPNIDMIDKKDELCLTAELPGMAESDIDVQVSDGMLTVSGEKKQETEEGDKEGDYYMSERNYGAFRRSVRLPEAINQDKIKAGFKNGVLTVHLPKDANAKSSTRHIAVKAQ